MTELEPTFNGPDDTADGDWHLVESKSNRSRKRRKIDDAPFDHRSNDQTPIRTVQPGISFHASKPSQIQAKALQELVLYVLADGVAPTWLAVRNKEHIDKVVVLMVPGLDKQTLERSKAIAHDDPTTGSTKAYSHQPKSSSPPDVPSSSSDASHTSWFAQNIVPVKGPGDSGTSKVHSPLHALLISPSQEQKQRNNATDDRPFHSSRTHISSFIQSSDDLREAEYPIHPAAFDNPRDAQLEQDRRESTFQSASSGWVDTKVPHFDASRIPPSPKLVRHSQSLVDELKPYALDCEMVLTDDDKYSLARISILDWHGKTILDKYVKPSLPIKNYFTQYSGITPEHLADVHTTLQDIQAELLSLITPDSILLGHSLDSDLNALKLTHPYIIDTSIIYPHPRGLPLRSSLKFLANRYLKREIQKGGANGHDSVEDARAVLDLVRLKCEKGSKWGTLDANGESILRRIARAKRPDGRERQSAFIEYGTPERGLGREATFKIACEDDDQIIQGVLRAAHGDTAASEALATLTTTEPNSNEPSSNAEQDESPESATPQQHPTVIPPGGVDFIWARLHELESIRGWNTPPPPLPENPTSADLAFSLPSRDHKQEAATNGTQNHTPSIPSTCTSTSTSSPKANPPLEDTNASNTLEKTITQTLQRIQKLYSTLPARTLVIIYSGTGDMRPYLKLQQLHAQYRKEFKVKNWDRLSVKWTDVEQQALRSACDKARGGVAAMGITG
ncbi:hypothetical protein PV10_07168 [Exophiala mesophila]|uniref:Exonuclease domain-containing protein n=1 Tax=Exophiala mesophila TaxID=212818 RepID=A0A0D1ZSI4_EXOME|nr:uncharacterized protein PV10_07168 [Exophiala mesophila]KIV89793.1 hypothetical protein PV10_07168 [Exophiala mesophila]